MQIVSTVSLLQVRVQNELHTTRSLIEVQFVLVRLKIQESVFSELRLRFSRFCLGLVKRMYVVITICTTCWL